MYTRHSKMRKKCIAAVLWNNFESGYLLAAKKEERRMFSQAIFCFDQKNLLRYFSKFCLDHPIIKM